MKRILILLFAAAALVLAAQTTVRVGMLSGPAGSVGNGSVLVLAPSGAITFASIGSGIALVPDGKGGLVLQAQSISRIVGAKPARQVDGTYMLTQSAVPSSLAVYRNGVRQTVGDDFTYDTGTKKITPVAGCPWNSDDLVVADFESQ